MTIDECYVNGCRVFYEEISRVWMVATSPDDLETFPTREEAHTFAANIVWPPFRPLQLSPQSLTHATPYDDTPRASARRDTPL